MHSITTRIALVLAAGTLMTACNSSTPSASGSAGAGTSAKASPTATPATGTKVPTSDFTITAATGWTDRTSVLTPSSGRKPVLLLSADIVGSQVTNSNDQRGDLDFAKLDPVVDPSGWQAYLDSAATSFGKGNPSDPTTITLGGESAMLVTYPIDTQGTPGKAEDIIVNHNGASYNITFTDSSVGYPAHIDDVTAMLATLTWK